MKNIINTLQEESGVLLRGGCALVAIIALGVGVVVGLIIGIASGDWYVLSVCGGLLIISLVITLISYGFNKIRDLIILSDKRIKIRLYGRYGITVYKINPFGKGMAWEIVKTYRTKEIISHSKTEVKFLNRKGLEQLVTGENIVIKDYLEDL